MGPDLPPGLVVEKVFAVILYVQYNITAKINRKLFCGLVYTKKNV